MIVNFIVKRLFVLSLLLLFFYQNSYAGTWYDVTQLNTFPELPGPVSDIDFDFNDSGQGIASWRQKDATGVYRIHLKFYNNGVWDQEDTSLDTIDFNLRLTQVAISNNGNAVACWLQFNGASNQIYASYYNRAIGWSSAEMIEDGSHSLPTNFPPQVAINDNGDAIIGWVQSDGQVNRVYSKHYDSNTEAWQSITQIDGGSYDASGVKLAMDSQERSIVVWHQFHDNAIQTYSNIYTKSTQSWSGPTTISNGTSDTSNVRLAFNSSGQGVAVWLQDNGIDNDIYHNQFLGGSWQGSSKINDDGVSASLFFPIDVAIDEYGNIGVLWIDNNKVIANTLTKSIAIRMSGSTSSWSGPIELEVISSSYKKLSIDFKNRKAVAAWTSDDSIRSSTFSTSWETPQDIYSENINNTPIVKMDNQGIAHTVFTNTPGNEFEYLDLRYKSKNVADTDEPWSGHTILATGSTFNATGPPTMAVNSSGNAMTAWLQYGSKGYSQVLAKFYNANSKTWEGDNKPIGGNNNKNSEIIKVAINDQNDAVILILQESDITRESNLYINRYNGLTKTWLGAELLDTGIPTYANSVSITMNNDGKIIVAYVNKDKQIATKMFLGDAWQDAQTHDRGFQIGDYPTIKTNNDISILAWLDIDSDVDDSYWQVYAKIYNIASATWGPMSRLDTGLFQVENLQLDLNLENNKAAVFWPMMKELDGDEYNLYASFYDDTTSTWSPPSTILGELNTNFEYYSGALAENGDALIVWQYENQISYDREIFANSYLSASKTWSGKSQMLNSLGSADQPIVGIDAKGNAFTFWRENNAIYGNQLFNGSWKSVIGPIYSDSENPSDPNMVTSNNGNTLVAWFDSDLDNRGLILAKYYEIICGDDVLEGDEECDDGNLKNGDGCDSLCKIETGGSGDTQQPDTTPGDQDSDLTVCGNGILEAGEDCDDGNNLDSDGCSANCLKEDTKTTISNQGPAQSTPKSGGCSLILD